MHALIQVQALNDKYQQLSMHEVMARMKKKMQHQAQKDQAVEPNHETDGTGDCNDAVSMEDDTMINERGDAGAGAGG